MRRLGWLLAVMTLSVAQAAELPVIDNADFEDGLKGWGMWPDESKTRWEIDDTVAAHGRASLRVTAVQSSDRCFVLTQTRSYQPNTVYRVAVLVKRDPQVAEGALSLTINWRDPEQGAIVDRSRLHDLQRRAAGDWVRWSGLILTPKKPLTLQFLLGVEHTVGRVWFDQVVFDLLGGPDQLTADVWTNLTLGVEIGSPPLQRFVKHKTANDTVYQMGRRYNALLFESAYAERELRDLERCAVYAGRPEPTAQRQAFAAAEQSLNRAYLAYGAAFRSGAEADWQTYRTAADGLEAALQALRREVGQALAALRPKEPVTLPEHLGRQPREVLPLAPDGRMSRLLFGCWSPTQVSEAERPFDLEFHSSAPGAPAKHTETELDFSNITKTCDDLQALGYSGTFGMLTFGVHEYLYAPKWLVDKHAAEPDFFKLSADGLKGGSRGNDHSLNYHHPAVRAHIRDYLKRYAEFCRNEPRVLFYETSQEAYPNFTTAKGLRETGYGPHAVADFRAWLTRRYGTVAKLNEAWGSQYAAIDTIEPPPDAYLTPEREVGPLVASFEAFRDDSYLDYLKLIYQSLKAGDPTKAVVARHSSLLRLINGARIFETCDVLSFHTRAPHMQMLHLYLNTLNRYHRKGLGYLEDFWGCQQEQDRIGDEVAQRRGLEKHITRCSTWGRTLQMKWYSYTTGSYLFTYNGNWLNPAYDLTTMRYASPGLAVAKQKVEKLDWVLTHSTIAPSRILVLQPSATMRNERPATNAYAALLELHELLFTNGFPYELVPEEYVEDGRAALTEFDVVILPPAQFLSQSLQQRLAAFATGGGTLLACGRPGERDELARPGGELLRKLAAARVNVPAAEAFWRAVESASAVGDQANLPLPAGQGLFVACATPGLIYHDAHRKALLDLLAAKSRRAAWPMGGKVEVVLRVAEDGGRYLFALNADVDQAVTESIVIDGPVQTAVDVTVDGGFPVPVGRRNGQPVVEVRLGPGDSAVLHLR